MYFPTVPVYIFYLCPDFKSIKSPFRLTLIPFTATLLSRSYEFNYSKSFDNTVGSSASSQELGTRQKGPAGSSETLLADQEAPHPGMVSVKMEIRQTQIKE